MTQLTRPQYTPEEEQLLKSNFERPAENMLISYMIPSDDTVNLAKTLFLSIALEYDMKCTDKGEFKIKAELWDPFITKIVFSLTSHSTKGFLAIIQYTIPNNLVRAISSFSSFVTSSFTECNAASVNDCKTWFSCSKHYHEGYTNFHERFFGAFQRAVLHSGLSYTPLDKNAICLNAMALPIGTKHTAAVSFQERRNYSIDISSEIYSIGYQLSVQVTCNKRVTLFVRQHELPTNWSYDASLPVVKDSDSKGYSVTFILDSLSTPKLSEGRWFFAVRGSNLFSRSDFTITARYEPIKIGRSDESGIRREANEQVISEVNMDRLSISTLMPDNDENWIIVADESSPEGRRIRPELITPLRRVLKKNEDQFEEVKLEEPEDNDSEPSNSQSLRVSIVPPSFSLTVTQEPPIHFICPITRELMEDPVVIADGHSYESTAIQTWLETNIRSPMTGEKMTHKIIIPNFNLKSQIDEWKETNSWLLDAQ